MQVYSVGGSQLEFYSMFLSNEFGSFAFPLVHSHEHECYDYEKQDDEHLYVEYGRWLHMDGKRCSCFWMPGQVYCEFVRTQ